MTVSVEDAQAYIDDMARSRGYVLNYHKVMAKHDFAVLQATLPSRKSSEHQQIDYLGAGLLAVALASLVLACTWGGTTYAWDSATIIVMMLASVGFIVAFCLVETRAAEPLIPLGLFRIAVFNVSSSVGFMVGFIMFGAIIFIPLYLQTVHGATPTSAGLQLLPMVGGMLITFILSGRLISRWGRYKVFPIFGTGVTAVGLYLLSLLTPTTSLLQSSLYMFVVGFGLGDWALFEALPRIGSGLTVLLAQCLAAPIAAITEWLWLGTEMTGVQIEDTGPGFDLRRSDVGPLHSSVGGDLN